MERYTFQKQIKVLECLISNRYKTLADICDEVGVSRRTFFRYIDDFREAGFEVLSRNNVFSISYESSFISILNESVSFSENELMFIASCVQDNKNSNAVAHALGNKLRRAYGIDLEAAEQKTSVELSKVERLSNAIEQKKKVVLEKYFSPHSQTCSDRLVEPYRLVLTRGEVRCYELSSGICKNFKIARIGKVRISGESWEHRDEHRRYYTDLFGFSGEDEIKIKLKVGYLAHRILVEEYGIRDDYFYEEDDSHWIFYCRVCSFQGIGRFVMGLFSDVEVLENEEFKEYLRKKIKEINEKLL